MYQSLPLKYRPSTFEEIIGQDLLVRYLSSLSKKNIGKNIIIHGGFGNGKTSSARIYAKALNCVNLTPSGSPCNKCENCSQSLVLEIDATTAGSKENITNILDTAKTPPLIGTYRVIILDEVQNLSKQAWDALLKPIEEPKDFQVFIFSTTELEKVRPAIRSRCQGLEVKNLSSEQSLEYLKSICARESFQYEDLALSMICHFSKGCLRDLIKNLEQVSQLGDITVDNARVVFNLGFLAPLLGMFLSIMDKNTKVFKNQISAFVESPKRITEVLKQFSLFLYYRHIQNDPTEINPAFSLIPARDLQGIWGKVEECLRPKIQENYLAFLSELNNLRESSFISLEIGLLELHNNLHIQKFEKGSVKIPVESNPEVKPGKAKGRKFVTVGNVYPEPIKEKAPEPPPPEDPKVYTHTLLVNGFSAETSEHELIVLE